MAGRHDNSSVDLSLPFSSRRSPPAANQPQIAKLDRLVLVGNEAAAPCVTHHDGATIFLVAGKNRLEPSLQLFAVRRPHADVPVELVVALLPAHVRAAKHHSPKTSGGERILQPSVAFGYVELSELVGAVCHP